MFSFASFINGQRADGDQIKKDRTQVPERREPSGHWETTDDVQHWQKCSGSYLPKRNGSKTNLDEGVKSIWKKNAQRVEERFKRCHPFFTHGVPPFNGMLKTQHSVRWLWSKSSQQRACSSSQSLQHLQKFLLREPMEGELTSWGTSAAAAASISDVRQATVTVRMGNIMASF